jgi:IPT/TIG domain
VSVLLAALPLTGCLEDLIKQVVPVGRQDGEVPFRDAATDSDLIIPDELTLTDVQPGHGPFVGGTEVELTGSGFGSKTAVTFGGKAVQAAAITILSPIRLKVVTPAGEVGLAEVKISRGGKSANLAGAYRYDPIYLDPASGPMAGSTLVTLQGKGTNFAAGMKLELGGKAMTDVEVISATSARAKTPPGLMGPAHLVYSEAKTDFTVKEAFTYYSAADPRAGGMGGGPLKGTLTVSVLNWLNSAPIPGAAVIVQKARTLQLTGTTDAKGQVVFTKKELTGPVTATAGIKEFESSTIVSFDARDLTIFLMPIASPQPGPLPPGTLAGALKGYVLFGGTTGAGSKTWKLVPEPKPGQYQRVYVFTTVPSLSWGPSVASSSATIDFSKSEGKTAWPYTIIGYTGGLAIYALAGLYDLSTGSFEPYAMGVTRGIVIGPGETVRADVWVNIPLTEKLKVQIKDAPPEVAKHSIQLAIDLGADGLIMTEQWQAAGNGVVSSASFGRLPPMSRPGLQDASFSVDALLSANTFDGLPVARATARTVQPKGGSILLDEWVGVPQQVKPLPGAALQGNTLVFKQGGHKHDLAVTVLRLPDETPVWRVISPGDVTRIELPDPTTFSLPSWPKSPLLWLQWLARLPGFNYNNFTYRNLSSRYWDRWSFDELSLKGP